MNVREQEALNMSPASDRLVEPIGDRPWPRPELPIGLGTNTFGRTMDEGQSCQVLDFFVEAGGTLVDTADTYSNGESEVIIGRWMRERGTREQVTLVSKVGNHADFDGLSAKSVAGGLESSLRRLSTDSIDIYFAHYEDRTVPVAESAAAFDAAFRAGKIRAVGLSNFAAATIDEWLDVARSGGLEAPVVLQPHYSLSQRQPYESEVAGIAAAEGLMVLPYRALGGGFLTGKYRTTADTQGRARGAGVLPLLTPAGLRLLDTLDAIARTHDVRPAAIALAWLLQQPTVTAPLASATSTTQLAELLAAPTVRMDDSDLDRLTAAADSLV
ncbi:aldo/keto reductase [Nakamurella sp. A5-74]|uniref:Aldo/keto reductase n=1 Tax=Nakamurella sp. A5-74 TaxID=3158264 RepID=A0AAU8DTW0_9ACTN